MLLKSVTTAGILFVTAPAAVTGLGVGAVIAALGGLGVEGIAVGAVGGAVVTELGTKRTIDLTLSLGTTVIGGTVTVIRQIASQALKTSCKEDDSLNKKKN